MSQLSRRVAALESARQPAEAQSYAELVREVFDSSWRGWPTTSSENAAALSLLAERLEAGDLEGVPPLIRASPAKAAALARAAAHLLTTGRRPLTP